MRLGEGSTERVWMGWVRKAGGGVNTMGFGGVSEAGEGSTEWVWVG